MEIFFWLKLLHILIAMMTVGFSASYGIWIARAKRQPEQLPYVLDTIHFIDTRFTTPGYALMFVTGALMMIVGGIPLSFFWLDTAIVLWFTAMALGFVVVTPNFRREIRALKEHGIDSPEYEELARRNSRLIVVVALVMLVIVYLMVMKPNPFA